ncbi:hypothetical protein QBC47DRAFT_403040 [Echria macrotheca]|uniref:Uncharacterized protein n=1 Tax=Echria macrotheca TaxID=438768 RepID=A0AAJ0BCM7_9PEZI|nr:hypothetical protein QBC47DRAFT_403040 [Echria macrotheca]
MDKNEDPDFRLTTCLALVSYTGLTTLFLALIPDPTRRTSPEADPFFALCLHLIRFLFAPGIAFAITLRWMRWFLGRPLWR